MENNTYYQKLLHERHADISLSGSILIIIGGMIGVIGNATIIFFYFFRIKEKGERYFIPLLATVDLLGCITSPVFFTLDNEYLYNYPSPIACRILSFLQVFIPGLSGHTLLLISIQRYILVCRPFGQKMTYFWKRFSFVIVSLVSIAYSIPLLITAGVDKENITFLNKNVTTEMCKFTVYHTPSMDAYLILLFVIMVANIFLTTCFYIPILKHISVSLHFRTTQNEIQEKRHADPQEESSQIAHTSESDQTSCSYQIKVLEKEKNLRDSMMVDFPTLKGSRDPSGTHKKKDLNHMKKKIGIRRSSSVQRRITIMFFVLIVVYVISYTPPLVIMIRFNMLGNSMFLTMTQVETGLWIYLGQMVILTHIINPLIYGLFDTKFREKLRTSCLK